jgi:hypothetical protein
MKDSGNIPKEMSTTKLQQAFKDSLTISTQPVRSRLQETVHNHSDIRADEAPEANIPALTVLSGNHLQLHGV